MPSRSVLVGVLAALACLLAAAPAGAAQSGKIDVRSPSPRLASGRS